MKKTIITMAIALGIVGCKTTEPLYYYGEYNTAVYTYLKGEGATLEEQITALKGTIELAVKRLPYGIPAQYLHDKARIGDSFHIDGGSGKFYYRKSKGGPLLLIAGGIGITPIISIARYVADNGLDIDMDILYSAATPSEFAFKPAIEEIIASSPRFNCIFTTTKDSTEDWSGRTGRIDSPLLSQYTGEDNDPLIYLCGPQPMIDDLKQTLIDIGASESKINAERWW